MDPYIRSIEESSRDRQSVNGMPLTGLAAELRRATWQVPTAPKRTQGPGTAQVGE
jgi:hypothetical protein